MFSYATLYSPTVNRVLGTRPVDLEIYLLAWAGVPLIFGADYLRKRLSPRARARCDVCP